MPLNHFLRVNETLDDFYNRCNNLSNFDCSEEEMLWWMMGSRRLPLSEIVPLSIVLVVIFLTGVIGNACVCVVIVRHPGLHTATNYYLFSLAVSDLLLLLFDNEAQQIVETNDVDGSSAISAAAAIPPPSGDPAPPPPTDPVAPSAPADPIAPPLADPVALPADTITQTETESVPELDPALLQALGDPADDTPAYGSDIHEKLAQRWLPILKKGLQKESKEQLLKDYAIPGNCKLLKAPTLNPEISAAVSEIVRSRDKKMQAKQDQMGLGITAVNRAMSLLLTGDDKVQAVKILSDGCRILSDLHFVETQVRTKLISPGLDKAFLSLIQDQDRDETLFGAKLPDKIKASKAIEKQGLQIKKGPIPKPSTSNSTSAAARNRQQGNWPGPPRLTSSSRGGHTAAYRTPAAYRRPPPAAQPATTRSSAATAANKRPQARQ